MAKTFSVREFEEYNLYSNKNIETVLRTLVNESSNAVLVSLFEDQAILLDHTTGQFYLSDYVYDRDKYTFVIENFEEINLEVEAKDLAEAAYDYFDNDEADTKLLSEAYKETMGGQNSFISDLVSECMAFKNWRNNVEYDKMVNESADFLNKPFVKKYVDALEKAPVSNIKFFDWANPVKVSIDEDVTDNRTISKSSLIKAVDLWKDPTFKKILVEASTSFVEDVDSGKEKMRDMFIAYPQLFMVESSDLKMIVGKALLSTSLKGNVFDITEGVIKLVATELGADKEKVLSENTQLSEDNEYDSNLDLTESELDLFKQELQEISENTDSVSVKEKIENLLESFDSMKNYGVNPSVVREAVSLLQVRA